MVIRIKNMVCDRCILVVRQQLEQLNFRVNDISLGEAEIAPEPGPDELPKIASALKILGFELIDNEKDKLVERIKNVIIEQVHHTDLSEYQPNFSELLSHRLHKDYGALSRLFSESEDSTIEHFIIQQKAEKVKELLQYGELNLNEIAWKMGYSSSAHLSAQFKKTTGLSPSQYKNRKAGKRKSLDKI